CNDREYERHSRSPGDRRSRRDGLVRGGFGPKSGFRFLGQLSRAVFRLTRRRRKGASRRRPVADRSGSEGYHSHLGERLRLRLAGFFEPLTPPIGNFVIRSPELQPSDEIANLEQHFPGGLVATLPFLTKPAEHDGLELLRVPRADTARFRVLGRV